MARKRCNPNNPPLKSKWWRPAHTTAAWKREPTALRATYTCPLEITASGKVYARINGVWKECAPGTVPVSVLVRATEDSARVRAYRKAA